jgi:tripartite-type tricarboxylate transporter receptor subunit TctC
LIGQWLSEHLGAQLIIENRPGAGNNIGTEAVVNAAPDGYTVLLVNPANGINTSLYRKLNFDFIRDIAPVAGLTRVPNVMEVNPAVPPGPCRSSSTTPKPIPERSTWRRPATARPCIFPVRCSR